MGTMAGSPLFFSYCTKEIAIDCRRHHTLATNSCQLARLQMGLCGWHGRSSEKPRLDAIRGWRKFPGVACLLRYSGR
jgi:hypothetical protein